MKVAMVIGLIAICLFAMGGVAFATDPPINSDPSNPQLGDPVPGNFSPHGGYSTTTNYCLNCHSVHAITSEYALMAYDSVTATCRTCHAYFGNANPAGPTTRPNYTGRQKGTAADRSAYDLEGVPGNHSLGETAVPEPDDPGSGGDVVITQSDWSYRAFPARGDNGPPSEEPAGPGTSSAAAGGLYCASCHTPHGDFGQLINSRWYRSEAVPTSGTSTNEQQRVTLSADVDGTTVWHLTLVLPGTSTASSSTTIAEPSSASAVAGALASFLGGANVLVSGPDGGPYVVTFQGTYAGVNMNQMSFVKDSGAGTGTVQTLVQGDSFTGSLEDVHTWQVNAPIYLGTSLRYLWQTPAGVWQGCTATNGGGTCANLTTTSTNGATNQYLYGYKLLSAYPNHNYGTPESWGVAQRSHDAARWCGACHPSYVTSEYGAPFEAHNHPTGCTACHGNPNTTANPDLVASFDFPHTSTVDKFLTDYPDSLCINCHTAGSLP